MKFLPVIGKSSTAGMQPSGTELSRARRFFSWGGLGAALLGVMFARWTWLLFAPAGAVMPPALPEASDDAGRLFGTAHQTAAAAATALTFSNIKLIGVFANPVQGFAVVRIDGKQRSVPLGAEVSPGVRLVETHRYYVVLDQGGVRSRLDLSAASAPAVSGAGPPQPASGAASSDGALPAQRGEALPHPMDETRGEQ
jgi:hypothetical protein